VSDFQLEHKYSYFVGLFPDLPGVATSQLNFEELEVDIYKLDALMNRNFWLKM